MPLDASTFATPSPPPASIQPNPDYVPAYILEPAVWVYDIDQGTGVCRATYTGEVVGTTLPSGSNDTRMATTAYVDAAVQASTTGVSSFNTRTGAVVLLLADVTSAGGAPQASPTFSGVPNAPTAAPGTNTTQLATTMFVTAAIGTITAASVSSFNGRAGAVTLNGADIIAAGGAPNLNPALQGTPTAPTANVGTNTTQIATTAFVGNALAGAVVSWNGRTGPVSLTLSDVTSVGGAPLASPAFTGIPNAPTAAPLTATTQLATTAFVTNAVQGATVGVSSFNGRQGAVTLQTADVSGVGAALLAGPAFTGTPTAPTPGAADDSQRLATTAFVVNALTGSTVASFNGRAGTVTLNTADITGAGGAPQNSPALTGTPTAPTAGPGTNTAQLATTAFVQTSFAPLASPALTGTPTVPTAAPNTNTTQAASTAFVETATAGFNGNVGRNLLHNGLFNVQQRGAGPWTTNGEYTLDRWWHTFIGGSMSITAAVLTDANRAAIGDESAQSALQAVVTGSATAGSYAYAAHQLEGLRRTAGKTVTLSFWAFAAAGTPNLGLSFNQFFGSGGSPSATVNVTPQVIVLSTTPTRYSATFAIPSVSGKVFGTNNDASLALVFCYTNATNMQATLGVVGNQSGMFSLWGVQLEVGATATPLEKPDPQQDLAKCQRFYQIGQANFSVGAGSAGWSNQLFLPFPVQMRTQPTLAVLSPNYVNSSGAQATAGGVSGVNAQAVTTATGGSAFSFTYTASADL